MFVNRHSRLVKIPDDSAGNDLYGFVVRFLEQRAGGLPALALASPLVPSLDVRLAPEEVCRGFLKLEDGPSPLTRDQARSLLPQVRSYADLRRHLRDLQQQVVDVLTEAQRERLTAIHHDVTYDLPSVKPVAAIREALERVAK